MFARLFNRIPTRYHVAAIALVGCLILLLFGFVAAATPPAAAAPAWVEVDQGQAEAVPSYLERKTFTGPHDELPQLLEAAAAWLETANLCALFDITVHTGGLGQSTVTIY